MSNHLKEALSAIESLKLKNLDWVSLREVKETTRLHYARDGKPEANRTEVSHGVMVETLVQGQLGYAATSKRDLEGILNAATQAHHQAQGASAWKVHSFSVDQRPFIQKRFQGPSQKPIESFSPGELNGLLVEICHKLQRSSKIVRTGAFVQAVDAETAWVSSNGSDAHQRFSYITSDFEATAQDGAIIQKRTDGGMRGRSYQGGWEVFQLHDLWERVEKVGEQALELLSAEECPSGNLSLLLKPDQMMLQIHESIGHPLELDRILGDERNYAGWSFVNPEDFGKLQYGSSLMNVTFDPTVPGEFASYAFDDTGTPAQKEYLIKDGLLLRGLGGLESQARSGLPGVASTRASSWNRAPIDRMGNLNLEPGESSLEEMIASIERGVLMESNRSWSIDDFRNKFQFGCEYGKLIENGKITKTLKNPNYRGVTVPFWTGLKKVGNASTWGMFGTPYCGKGEPNQAIRVGHASPVCLFDNVEIFGGAS
jgi:predicted Zn-dependent protease